MPLLSGGYAIGERASDKGTLHDGGDALPVALCDAIPSIP
jgi:hypothetical protein